MKITYRPAVPKDAAQLLEYLKAVGGETDNLTFGAAGIPFTLEQERRYLESLQTDPCNSLLLALDGDRIVGSCSLSGSRSSRLCHWRELGITVRRAYWGLGIGTEFIRRMIDAALDENVERLNLSVRTDNLRAKALYSRMGFVRCGAWPDYFKVDGRSYDVELMSLDLKAVRDPRR